MIKQIPITNLEDAFHIFSAVKKDMITNGIDQWDEIYPNFDIIELDVSKQQAYGYFINEQLSAYVALNESFDKEYHDIVWKYHDAKPLIVHRLAVKPKCQGMGIAKALMKFAEDKATKDGYKTIRLDAFSGNPKALGLYTILGYHFAGLVTFRKGTFHCFEKMIG